MEKTGIGIFTGSLVNSIPRSRTDLDQRTDCIHHTIDRKNQVQNRQTVGSGIDRDKISIRQNIDRDTDHSGDDL